MDTEDLSQVLTKDAFDMFLKNNEYERKKIFEDEYNKIKEYRDYLKSNVFKKSPPETVLSPVNFERIIINVVRKFGLDDAKLADVDPIYVAKKTESLLNMFAVDPNEKINYVSTILIKSLAATNLSTKNLIYKYKINKIAMDHLIQTLLMTFMKVLINPGEMVGVIAAQSIGEPTTQMTLDTFHHTGLGSKANVSRGVPRFRELLSLTGNPKTPSLTIQIEDEYFTQFSGHINDDKDIKTKTNKNTFLAEKIAAKIEHTTLESLLFRTEIYYDADDSKSCLTEDQDFIDSYYQILPTMDNAVDAKDAPWLLRMEFNREVIMNQNIRMSTIETQIRLFLKEYGLEHTVIVSDDNAYKLICRIKITNIENYSDPIDYLRALEKNIIKLKIKGIDGIQKGHVRAIKKDIVLENGTVVTVYDQEYEETAKTHQHLQYVIDTDGSNLDEVLNLEFINQFNTISNDVWEIYKNYGIEAARNCLIYEIVEVLEYSGTSISRRHIELLVDVISNQGILVSVDRHGVNKSESGPLHRASFEETTTQITNASIFNEVDHMTGVSGNIMFGQFIHAGTNSFRIGLDIEKIKTQEHPEQPLYRKPREIDITNIKDSLDICNPVNFEFDFKLNTIN
jgi:DNA-directed RNA polymerase II subunit RPB1